MSKIKDVIVEYYRIPLPELVSDAKHGVHTHFEVPIVKILTDDGREGVGYTYTGGFGGRSIAKLIQVELRNVLLGKDPACVEDLWEKMQTGVHYVGHGGLASFAISACDIALWDLRAKKAQEPLWKLLGGHNREVKAYGGAIDLAFPLEKLLSHHKNYLDMGLSAIKIKLGQKTLAEDIARVKALRELVGPDVEFMVDANMGWTVAESIRAARELLKYDILFLEEPIDPNNYEGHRIISERTGMSIAAGENLRNIKEFYLLMTEGKVDFPQPDAANIGGITGFMKVANLAKVLDLKVSSHGMQELHVSLLAALPNAGYLEVHSFPIDQYTKRPLVINKETARAVAPDTIGIGVEFDFEKLAPHKLDF